eukprot:403357812
MQKSRENSLQNKQNLNIEMIGDNGTSCSSSLTRSNYNNIQSMQSSQFNSTRKGMSLKKSVNFRDLEQSSNAFQNQPNQALKYDVQNFQNQNFLRDRSSTPKSNNKIDFTDIIYQLQQPSTIETPMRFNVGVDQNENYQINDNSNNIRQFQQFPHQHLQFSQYSKAINAQQGKTNSHSYSPEETKNESSSYAIAQLNDLIQNQKAGGNIGAKKIIFEIQDVSQNNPKNSQYNQQSTNKKPKINMKEMESQLDDLKDHIKSLEQKIDYTAKSHNIIGSPKRVKSQSSINKNKSRSRSKSNKKQLSSRSRLKPSDLTRKLSRSGSSYQKSQQKLKVSESSDAIKNLNKRFSKQEKAESKAPGHSKNISWGDSTNMMLKQQDEDYGKFKRQSYGVSSSQSQDKRSNLKSTIQNQHNRVTSESSNYMIGSTQRSLTVKENEKLRKQLLESQASQKSQNADNKFSISALTHSNLHNSSKKNAYPTFAKNSQDNQNKSYYQDNSELPISQSQNTHKQSMHNKRESDGGNMILSTYRCSDIAASNFDVIGDKRFSDIEIPNNLLKQSRRHGVESEAQFKLLSEYYQNKSNYQGVMGNQRYHSKSSGKSNQREQSQASENNAKRQSLPQNQKQLLDLKIKEVENLKSKNLKLKKKVKLMKSEITEKDQVISNYKNLNKELRTLKDQYRLSEDLRDQQALQVKKLQQQLAQFNKENSKLKRKLVKQKEKENMPIKVTIEDKSMRNQEFQLIPEKLSSTNQNGVVRTSRTEVLSKIGAPQNSQQNNDKNREKIINKTR